MIVTELLHLEECVFKKSLLGNKWEIRVPPKFKNPKRAKAHAKKLRRRIWIDMYGVIFFLGEVLAPQGCEQRRIATKFGFLEMP